MFPFPYTGLRLVHDAKVGDAMERARTDAELAGDSQRIVQLFLFRNVLVRIRSWPNTFVLIEYRRLRRYAPAKGLTRDSW
jgi:hypothetical protein